MAEADDKKWNDITPNDLWRIYLTEGHKAILRKAPLNMKPTLFLEDGILKLLPSNPRCQLCFAPFKGLGAPLMRAIGKDRSHSNSTLCSDCERFVKQTNAGVEIEASLLFADIRGSTGLAEKTSAAEYGKLINRFFSVATDIFVMENGFIEKLTGDQVSGYFVPGLAGSKHPEKALKAAVRILKETGHADRKGPWVPVGAALHIGPTYIGAVGNKEGVSEIAMLGDTANTAARLASAAGAGELLVSEAMAKRSELDLTGLEKRSLDLKGKSESIDVWVVRVDAEKN
jgi:adenylate cyclase